MNTPITFPPFAPKLQLPRRTPEITTAELAAQSRRLQDEAVALREREQQLFGEEARLRALHVENAASAVATSTGPSPSAESSATGAPFFHRPGSAGATDTEVVLHTGWDQLKRARAL